MSLNISPHLRLSVLSGLFYSVLPTETLYTPIYPCMLLAPSLSRLL
jgi:hypothetical protein